MSLTPLDLIVAAWVAAWVDRRWGEPPLWLHPVVAMGRYLGALGPWLCARSPVVAGLGGALAWCVGAAACVALAAALSEALAACLRWAGAHGASTWVMGVLTALAGATLGLLLKPLMAWRMLHDEVAAVESALAESLDAGRARLQRLVSRDVSQLDEAQVRESALESLAENLNDSVVAPLFWFALGGLPGAALYRFANTADAMWGYRGRYEWAGKWAAHADDLLSWLPARLTALLLCLAARRGPGLAALRHEAAQTPSPNGGWPMGAMAHLLGVRLSKPGVYVLNAAGGAPQAAHTPRALAWCDAAVRLAWWCLTLSCLIAWAASGPAK
ncbi:MAG: cobalamin biosynthesis protein CobD [Burkholderiales bacterium]|nr:cobalamin biosynthesis protein CobD [Burkholderiales bacterium]